MIDTSWARLQPNTYTCGPAALRHALRCYGVRASVRRLAELAGTTPEAGTDEQGLAFAAQAYGFKLQHVSRNAAPIARAALLATVGPVICTVDRLEHWITVVASTARAVHYLDSEGVDPKQVNRRVPWREFLRRAVDWYPPNEPRFDLYPLVRA